MALTPVSAEIEERKEEGAGGRGNEEEGGEEREREVTAVNLGELTNTTLHNRK